MTCQMEGCERPALTRGLCRGCYQKALRLGIIEQVAAPSKLPRVSPEELAQIVAWRRRGISNARIAVEIGRTPECIAALLCKARKAGRIGGYSKRQQKALGWKGAAEAHQDAPGRAGAGGAGDTTGGAQNGAERV